jgi:hypothetical protein
MTSEKSQERGVKTKKEKLYSEGRERKRDGGGAPESEKEVIWRLKRMEKQKDNSEKSMKPTPTPAWGWMGGDDAASSK